MCSTSKDAKTRSEPRKVSSVFMENNWTYHAYSMSHDGKSTIVHRPDGIELVRQGRPNVRLEMELPYNPRDFYWHPDCKRVAFWVVHTPKPKRPGQIVHAARSVAVMDVTRVPATVRPGDPPPYEVVYVSPPDMAPFGLEWSPRGDALYLIQRGLDPVTNESYGALTRIELNDVDDPKEIVRMPGGLDFFMPPVSRFERGEGPSSAKYQIIFGHMEGLYTVEPDGKNPQRLSQLPAVGLYNIEWNPKPNMNQVILFFRRPIPGGDGRTFVGAYLVRLDDLLRRRGDAEAEAGAKPAIEQLYDGTDVHTLWYSPRGTYMTWATPWGLWFRRPDDAPDKTVQVTIPAQPEGAALEIKGVTWKDDESKLAFTAGNKLFVYEVGSKEAFQVAEFGKDNTTFAAEPRFVGDEVYLTAFEDANASGRIRKGLVFGTPDRPVDPTLGRGGDVPAPNAGSGSSSGTSGQPGNRPGSSGQQQPGTRNGR